MSIEDLLKPRYKVIADYPKCPFDLGMILIQDINTVGEIFTLESEVGERFESNWIDKDEPIKYPHLFKKLEWWQEREWRPKWLKWTSLFAKVRTTIDVHFSKECGRRKGSYKGGTIGCNYELLPNEKALDCLKRMEKERKF